MTRWKVKPKKLTAMCPNQLMLRRRCKAMSGMLDLSMATMYNNAMSRDVEANYEKSIRNYYAKSINMAKILDETIDQRDRYYKEGQHQNGLVKDLLEQNA